MPRRCREEVAIEPQASGSLPVASASNQLGGVGGATAAAAATKPNREGTEPRAARAMHAIERMSCRSSGGGQQDTSSARRHSCSSAAGLTQGPQYPPFGRRTVELQPRALATGSPGLTPLSAFHALKGTSPKVGINISGQCTSHLVSSEITRHTFRSLPVHKAQRSPVEGLVQAVSTTVTSRDAPVLRCRCTGGSCTPHRQGCQ